jgi:large subunit ribosomal protein L6
MSRIGKQPVKLPSGVTAEITASHVNLKGSKGTLSFNILTGVQVKQEEGSLIVSVENPEDKQQRAYWGLTRAMLQNMAVGVSDGYTKSLEIQ